GGVQFGGLQSRNIRIHHDALRLSTYNMSAEDLLRAVQMQHTEMPAGYIQSKLTEANLRTMGEAYTLKDLNRLPIAQKNHQQVYLKDVAVIEDGAEDRRSFARYSRMPAVAVGVRKAIGGNLVAVCENVRKQIGTPDKPGPLLKMLPPGVELHVPVDYSIFVKENVAELKLTLFLGIVFTAVVCFLFLGSLGTTINICLSIPTSLIGTFFVLKYGVALFGLEPFTINLMTLLGLSLSVGVVVDDAILVLENIYRHREMGQSKREAALLGAREITFAALAATFSIMAIFLPVAFMKGTIGKFFFQFGVTVSVAVFLSLLCALTLTPMLCAYFLNLHQRIPKRPPTFGLPLSMLVGTAAAVAGSVIRLLGIVVPEAAPYGWWPASLAGLWLTVPDPSQLVAAPWWWAGTCLGELVLGGLLTKFGNQVYWAVDRFVLVPCLLRPTEWLLDKTSRGYARLLEWSLRGWPVVLGSGGALVAIAFVFIYCDLLGMELTPSEDQSRFVVRVVGPVGSSIDYIDNRLQECERRLQSLPEVASFLTTVATEPGQLINEADIFVQLIPKDQRRKSQLEVMGEVRARLEEVADVRVVLRDLSTEGFTPQRGDPVDVAIQGDWERLPKIAQQIMERMRRSGCFVDIDSDYRPGMPEVRIRPDHDKLALLNMTMAHLANSLSLHVGGQRIAKYTEGGRRYDIRMRLQWQQRASPSQLEPILLRAGDNRLVPLGDVATIEIVSTLPV
ncbi:MAG: efflux RND transporter permease subunit, partial [Gemmataceae bacterium]|nr:efflux RND transporter permease subunit [Gemmataceae bacterium]